MKLARKACLAVLVLTLGLAVCELAARAWSHFYFPKMIELDDHFGWRRTPGLEKEFTNEWGETSLVVANRYGNRGVAYAPKRTPGTYRVLVLGDSFAEGAQVNEADVFSALVEAREPGVEMINAALVAYGTVQEYMYLRDEGLAFHPDLVLVCFYRNDFVDNILPYHLRMGPRPYAKLANGAVHIVEEITDEPFSAFCIPAPLTVFFYRHSYIYYALTDRVYFQRHRQELSDLDRANMDRVPWPDRKRVFFHLIERMNDLARAHDAELALFLIPSQQELADGASPDHDEIARWSAANGIDSIRGLEPMQRAIHEGRRPYFNVDIHWTRAGHEIAAAEIAKYVREKRAIRDSKGAANAAPR